MRIISNDKVIRRNTRLGNYLSLGSVVVLVGGLILSFLGPAQYISYSFLALLLGFIMSQIGIFFTNRYGRKPRNDEAISAALKGLDDKYSLYHYMTPVSHLLVGPAGVWVLIPYLQTGTITFDERKNRWHQKGGNLYLKIFAQESLGRPDLEVTASQTDMERFLQKNMPEEADVKDDVNSAIIFLNEKATVDADNAPTPTMHIKKLKDFVRRKAKEAPYSMDKAYTIQGLLPQDSITI